jgi:hypothetical protein
MRRSSASSRRLSALQPAASTSHSVPTIIG